LSEELISAPRSSSQCQGSSNGTSDRKKRKDETSRKVEDFYQNRKFRATVTQKKIYKNRQKK
jgi:hypothetical protein